MSDKKKNILFLTHEIKLSIKEYTLAYYPTVCRTAQATREMLILEDIIFLYIFYLERGEADVISWVSCSVRLLYENLLVWQRNNGRNFPASVIFQTRNFS